MDKKQALKWQIEMGADEAISDVAPDRLCKSREEGTGCREEGTGAREEGTGAREEGTGVRGKGLVISSESLHPVPSRNQARKLADNCKTLEELREAVENFDGLSIKKTATNTVFSDGNPEAKIMFIGEAPGANEDLSGIPFCGASGKLLDKMLEWAGFTREKNFYITNTLFWRPPGNRKPTPEETSICLPFVEKHISLIAPKLLVLVGATSASTLLNDKTGITKLRKHQEGGNYFSYTNTYLDSDIKTAVLFHPSYLLRQPMQKRPFWKDLLEMRKFLSDNNIT